VPRAVEAAPAAAAVPRGESGDIWREFVTFVGKEQKFLGSHLDSGTALSLPPAPLKIGVSERHHLAYLQDSDNLSTLNELARRFFTQDVTVQIASVAAERGAMSGERGQAQATNPGDERSEMVKEALRIFGGSIRNVRRDNG
jgi:hypothetical protein